jgi:KaiC/GvpD/RAD55 family RecA-like ATPase
MRLALRLASDIIPKLPQKGETPVHIFVKLLAIVDSAQTILAPVSKRGALDDIVELYNLEQTKNEQFVSLFFDTNLYQQFETHRFQINDFMEVIWASHASFGNILFMEYSYSNSGPEDTFYHTKGIPFSEILRGLWESYDGRLHVTITEGGYDSTRTEFAPFKEGDNPLYGPMAEKLDTLVERHRAYTQDGFPRSYMFKGVAGTGKSSFATKFASRLGKRTVKMDAVSLTHAHVKEITFLLDSLNPDFIIFDDMDKADVTKGLPTILDVVQRFKTDYKKTSIIMTANSVSNFDEGLLRPGRIDTWVEFKLPDAEERRTILEQYINQLESKAISEAEVASLVRATSKLSHDYIREVALQLRYEPTAHVLENVAIMRQLLKDAKKEGKAPTAPSTAKAPE